MLVSGHDTSSVEPESPPGLRLSLSDAATNDDIKSTPPPTDGLASYDLFIKWVLLSPTSTVEAESMSKWPSDLDPLDEPAHGSNESQEFATTADAKMAQAAVEADHEALVDTLFDLEREIAAFDAALDLLEHEKAMDQVELEQCERHLLERLKERDDTVAEQFALEQQIAQVEQLGPPEEIVAVPPSSSLSSKFLRRGMTKLNLPFGWTSKNQLTNGSGELDVDLYHDTTQVRRDIELHEKRLAHEKLSLAEAKSDLDTQVFSNRLLSKKVAKLQESLHAFQATQVEAKEDLDQMHAAYAATTAKLKMVPKAATSIQKSNITTHTPQARAST